MRNIHLLLICALLIGVVSCKYVDPLGDVPSGYFFDKIECKAQSDNVLRYDLTVDMLHEAEVWAEYWNDQGDTIRSERVRGNGPGNLTVRLILLQAKTKYTVVLHADAGAQRTVSPQYEITTGALPVPLDNYPVYVDKYPLKGYILTSLRMIDPGMLILFNARGNVVWYQKVPSASILSTNFDARTQTFTCLTGAISDVHPTPKQVYVGFTSKELTTINLYGEISFHKTWVDLGNMLLHHDARLMADGNYIVVHFVQRQFDLTQWGGTTQETVTGDGFSIVSPSGKVLRTWDCFQEIDPRQDPRIMERSPLGLVREDWIHANAVYECPDGNVLMSFNFLSQIWKINIKTGQVMWRLGKGGNIPIPADATPSSTHNCTITPSGNLLFYDNKGGAENGVVVSRILAYRVDDLSRTAAVVAKINLGLENSSFNQSSVFEIAPNRYFFGSTMSSSIGVVDELGTVLYRVVAPHQSYRSYHIASLTL